jgi:TolB-like protein
MKRIVAAIVCAVVFSAALAAKDTLAVLPFSGGINEEGETIAELFSFSRELNEVFVPIPRTSISRAISNEQKFQTSAGMTDPDTIASIGKQLGAKYVVAGSIAELGNRKLLIISILKIDDLRQVAGDIQTYMRIEEIQDKLPAMARNIISAIEIDSSGFEKLAVLPVALSGGNIDSRVADTLAQILSINLIRSGKYAVYPRTATLEQVQEEYKTQLSGAVADEHMVDMGKADNPRLVLSVAARRLGNRNMFNASLINLVSAAQELGLSVNYETLDDGITVMESLARELSGVTTGSAPEISVLPEISAIPDTSAAPEPAAKPARSSGGAVFGYGMLNLALGLGSFIQGDVGGGVLTLLSYGAAAGLIFWELSLDYHDEMAGIPGALGIGAAGFAVLYGFIRPIVFNNNRPLAEVMDGARVAVAPAGRGGAAIRLSYTLKF